MSDQIHEALTEYHRAEECRQFAERQAREARNELLDAMHISSRYTTLGRKIDERSRAFRKSDVDYQQHLTPSMRKTLRALTLTLKEKP